MRTRRPPRARYCGHLPRGWRCGPSPEQVPKAWLAATTCCCSRSFSAQDRIKWSPGRTRPPPQAASRRRTIGRGVDEDYAAGLAGPAPLARPPPALAAANLGPDLATVWQLGANGTPGNRRARGAVTAPSTEFLTYCIPAGRRSARDNCRWAFISDAIADHGRGMGLRAMALKRKWPGRSTPPIPEHRERTSSIGSSGGCQYSLFCAEAGPLAGLKHAVPKRNAAAEDYGSPATARTGRATTSPA